MVKYSPDDTGFLRRAKCPRTDNDPWSNPAWNSLSQLRQFAEWTKKSNATAREREADVYRRVFEFMAKRVGPNSGLDAKLRAAEALRIFPDAKCDCGADRHSPEHSGLCTDLRQHLGIAYECYREWTYNALPRYMADQLDKDLASVKDTRKHYAIITNYMALNEARIKAPVNPRDLVHWPSNSGLSGNVSRRRLRKFLRQYMDPPMHFQKRAETSYFVTHMLALQHLRSVAQKHGLTILNEDPRWSNENLSRAFESNLRAKSDGRCGFLRALFKKAK